MCVRRGVEECEDASAEARADHPRAAAARAGRRTPLDEVELGTGDLCGGGRQAQWKGDGEHGEETE